MRWGGEEFIPPTLLSWDVFPPPRHRPISKVVLLQQYQSLIDIVEGYRMLGLGLGFSGRVRDMDWDKLKIFKEN